jgi:hypothetical protein
LVAQSLLGCLEIGDVRARANVTEKLAAVGDARHAERFHPAVLAVMAVHAKVGLEGRALARRVFISFDELLVVVGMNVARP